MLEPMLHVEAAEALEDRARVGITVLGKGNARRRAARLEHGLDARSTSCKHVLERIIES